MFKINLYYNSNSFWSDFIRQNSFSNNTLSNISWTILSGIEQQIKAKVERVGTPLKSWKIEIYRGILTGLNDAFIIDSKKKDELILADPKSAEVIRPILRGRDIKDYNYIDAKNWIIALFPSKRYNIENFPAIKKHLLTFGKELLIENGYSWLIERYLEEWCYKRLNQTGEEITINGKKIEITNHKKARKATANKWFETQDSISYWEDFYKQKIIWIELVDKGRFAFDYKDNFMTLNGTFIMTGDDLEYICSILNNPVTSWHFNTFCISSGVGTNQWRELYVKELYIPNIALKEKQSVIRLFDEIINADELKRQQSKQLELNNLVYNILNLNAEEIEFIESQ